MERGRGRRLGMWLHVSAASTESWRTRDTLFTPQLNAKAVILTCLSLDALSIWCLTCFS